MLIGIKCYKDGDTGDLQIFYGSVSIGFLLVVCSFAESAQGLRQTGSNSQSQSTWFQSAASWSKEVSFSDSWILYKTQDILLSGLGMRTHSFHENVKNTSCYFSVLNNSRGPALAGTGVMHSRLLYMPL